VFGDREIDSKDLRQRNQWMLMSAVRDVLNDCFARIESFRSSGFSCFMWFLDYCESKKKTW